MSQLQKISSFLILFFISLHTYAGIGGSSGGAAGYTAEVCQTSENGKKFGCREVKFNRPLGESALYVEPTICDGEGQNTLCDKPDAKVPELLHRINKYFKDRGYNTPNGIQNDPNNPYLN